MLCFMQYYILVITQHNDEYKKKLYVNSSYVMYIVKSIKCTLHMSIIVMLCKALVTLLDQVYDDLVE